MSEIGEKGVAAADQAEGGDSILDIDPEEAKLVSDSFKNSQDLCARSLQRKLSKRWVKLLTSLKEQIRCPSRSQA